MALRGEKITTVSQPPSSDAAPAAPDAHDCTGLTLADIKELFTLMKANDIAEIDLKLKDAEVRIVSAGNHPPASTQIMPVMHQPSVGVMSAPVAAPVPAPSAAVAAPTAAPKAATAAETAAATAADAANTIRSPMVGTFYGSPAPDVPSFVKVGDTVGEETVLCIIEAMKLMNEIKAERKGRIARILVETGMPVQYNQPLFAIEPE